MFICCVPQEEKNKLREAEAAATPSTPAAGAKDVKKAAATTEKKVRRCYVFNIFVLRLSGV